MPATQHETELTLADLLTGEVQLASPPALYFELCKAADDPTKSSEKLGNIIGKDPNLCTRLLKIVNSAFFAFPSQIRTISRAITLIGIDELQTLLLSTLIIDKFSALPGGMPCMRDYWRNCLNCALLARLIGGHLHNSEGKEALFVCGLLHEIGQLLFYLRIPQLARDMALQAEAGNIEVTQAERKLLGFDHYQAGAVLARLWRLPELIAATIANHHDPLMAKSHPQESAIVRLAWQLGIQSDMASPCSAQGHLLKIPQPVLQSMVQQAGEELEEIVQLFCPG